MRFWCRLGLHVYEEISGKEIYRPDGPFGKAEYVCWQAEEVCVHCGKKRVTEHEIYTIGYEDD